MRVYVCGPITMGGTELRAELLTERIETAELVAAALMLMGHDPMATHPICRHQAALDSIPQRVALDSCLRLLMSCGAVAAIDGWEHSGGCIIEVEKAKRAGILFIGPSGKFSAEPVEWTRADALRILGVE